MSRRRNNRKLKEKQTIYCFEKWKLYDFPFATRYASFSRVYSTSSASPSSLFHFANFSLPPSCALCDNINTKRRKIRIFNTSSSSKLAEKSKISCWGDIVEQRIVFRVRESSKVCTHPFTSWWKDADTLIRSDSMWASAIWIIRGTGGKTFKFLTMKNFVFSFRQRTTNANVLWEVK